MGLIRDECANLAIGRTQYEKIDGHWHRLRRVKNPAYLDQPQYFFIAPGPEKLAFIVCKMPRKLTTSLWRTAIRQIYRDATGRPWMTGKRWSSDRHQPIVDGADEDVYLRRVAGKKPEPAYELFIDGTWKRTSPA